MGADIKTLSRDDLEELVTILREKETQLKKDKEKLRKVIIQQHKLLDLFLTHHGTVTKHLEEYLKALSEVKTNKEEDQQNA